MLTLHRSLRGRQMEKIKKFWNAVSYEVVIAAGLIVWFLTGRALDLQGWSSAWNAMDYSMGTGSRLLIGSIYRLFYGEYLDYTVAYKYVAVGTMLTILVLAIVLGRMIRLAVAKNDQIRHAVFGGGGAVPCRTVFDCLCVERSEFRQTGCLHAVGCTAGTACWSYD